MYCWKASNRAIMVVANRTGLDANVQPIAPNVLFHTEPITTDFSIKEGFYLLYWWHSDEVLWHSLAYVSHSQLVFEQSLQSAEINAFVIELIQTLPLAVGHLKQNIGWFSANLVYGQQNWNNPHCQTCKSTVQLHANRKYHKQSHIIVSTRGTQGITQCSFMAFLTKGVCLGMVSHWKAIVITDASLAGWSATLQSKGGVCSPSVKVEYINQFEVRVVYLAGKIFLSLSFSSPFRQCDSQIWIHRVAQGQMVHSHG